jgi:hypothetical protein
MKTRRAVDAVAIEQRERRVAELRRARHERFGKRRTLQKAERRGCVQLDVHRRKEASARESSDFSIQISDWPSHLLVS